MSMDEKVILVCLFDLLEYGYFNLILVSKEEFWFEI